MNQDLAWYFVLRDGFAAIVGLAAGSLLTTTALRTLDEKSLVAPLRSACAHCQHRLALHDLIPLLSFCMLRGKCRYCAAGIGWHYPLLELLTAAFFAVLVHMAQTPVQFVGMSVFVCTLIAVCITDFKRMLIPHEITYPSMLLGIVYSASTRPNGLQDALIGVGLCYIFFDFLAFYGLKTYLFLKKYFAGEERDATVIDRAYEQIQKSFELRTVHEDEEFVVMGGGDAVLAAVVAAWLGTQFIGIFLAVAFVMGGVTGAIYRACEMHKQGVLKRCAKPCLIGITVAVALVEVILVLVTGSIPNISMITAVGIAAALCGVLIGMTFEFGQHEAKPFPFGPAIAAGAVVAMLSAMWINHGANFL